MKAFFSFYNYILNARFTSKESIQALLPMMINGPQSFFGNEIPSYNEESEGLMQKLQKLMEDKDVKIHLTRHFDDDDKAPYNSIAYYRVFGTILADDDYSWYFSSKEFLRHLSAAESNPNIIAHFVHISSGGGEAWLLDKVFEAIWNTSKPVIAFIEKAGCSAAYYYAAPADVIYCYTQNDTIGSIGTMVYFWDMAPYYVKEGFHEVEEYATKSTLKNKKFNLLLDGKPERYIKEELDPLQQQFEASVRKARTKLAKLPDDDPIFAGETYSGILAKENGLIDELADVETAIMDAYTRGLAWRQKNEDQNNALKYL